MTAITKMQSAVQQDDPRFAALLRMRASRVQLEAALIPQQRKPGDSGGIGGDANDWGKTARTLWRFMRSRNVAGLFETGSSFMGQWWSRHPWRPAVTLLGQAADAEVAPWVRKHPTGAIALGVCAGAAIAWIRPWRWNALHVPARSIGRSASHWLLRELTSPAMQMLIATSLAAWLGVRNAKSSAASGEPGASGEPAAPDA